MEVTRYSLKSLHALVYLKMTSYNLKTEGFVRAHTKMYNIIKNIYLLLIFGQLVRGADNKDSKQSALSMFDDKLIYKLGDFANYITKILANYNDHHLGSSEWGQMIGYDELKPKLLDDNSRKARGLKKMSMAMMPLVFHVGATSTWMLITSLMAAKSVAIGLLLLVFKIAVSSAKVASFFTLLKSKHSDHHHHEAWAWSPPHGHDRSLSQKEIPVIHEEWSSYNPEWSPNDHHPSPPAYKTIPTYKENTISSNYEEIEYEDTKKL